MHIPSDESSPPTASPPKSARIGFWIGLAVFAPLYLFFDPDPTNPLIGKMAAIAVLMAIWWITEAIPLAATSLLPLALFPLASIASGKEIAPYYINSVIFLFIGGFLLALAMERWNLHRRIALRIILLVGVSPARLVLGFMLATAALSMWISNTATAIMMLAIGLAVIKQAEETFGRDRTASLSAALLLGIAYSSSIGGLATLVGTPPNLALVRLFEVAFPGAAAADYHISFGQWMLFGLPLSVILLAAAWLVLTQICFRSKGDLQLDPHAIRDQYLALGRMSREEMTVLAVFIATALLWVFRSDLTLGTFVVPGWARLIPGGKGVDDGTVAIAMALLLFLLPSGRRGGERGRILGAEVFPKLPWGIVLLFGGGFALAQGFQTSGLSNWIGAHFAGLESAPDWVLVGAISTLITFLTELTSNIATTEMILPVLASIATAAKIHPLMLMIPAAISASCAFMMPVATPPNAIVFASGRIRIIDMVWAGLLLNLIAVVVVTVVFLLIGPSVFGIDSSALPTWVK